MIKKKFTGKREKLHGLGKLTCGAKVICHLPAVGTCEISKSASMPTPAFFFVFPQIYKTNKIFKLNLFCSLYLKK